MMTSLRHLGIALMCETCDAEVDLHVDEGSPVQCHLCGLVFAIDDGEDAASSRRSA